MPSKDDQNCGSQFNILCLYRHAETLRLKTASPSE